MIASAKKQDSSAARFLVAKYVSDLRRGEQKNIGVVLWNNGEVAHRFLSPDDALFVNDERTYGRWIRFWESEISKPEIQLPRAAATKSDPAYLDVLKRTQGGNYQLVEGGELLRGITTGEIDSAADFLFDELVAPKSRSSEAATESLQSIAQRAFTDIGLWDSPEFQHGSAGYDVECKIHNVEQPITFHYAIVDTQVRAVFHRVRVDHDQSWQSAVLRFEALLRSKRKLRKQNCAALIVAGPAAQSNPKAASAIRVLNDLCIVADMTDYRAGLQTLESVRGNAA